MKIIVTGSLGHIGEPLTEQLVQNKHEVTVISSNPERQQPIEAKGATAAIGSLEDVDFLTQTFSGAQTAFLMVPPNFKETDQLAYYRRIAKNYVQALQQTEIQHAVLLSSYGAHLDHGTGFILGSYHAEQILNKLQNIALTCLRPGYFYYNLFGFKSMIEQQGMMGANYGGNDKIMLVAPADIATVAAEELQRTPAPGTNLRYVASDEHTADEIAQIIGAAVGKPDLKWLTFTSKQMKEGLAAQGFPEYVVNNFVELGESLHSGALLEDYERHAPIPMGKVKLEDFAREFAATF